MPGRFTLHEALLLGSVIALGVGARAWLLFSTPWVPGINGAYYLVQARALIERGQLGIPDLPLLFYGHAGLAKILMLAASLSVEDAVLHAVKVSDALLPPLAAGPVYLLVRRWSARLGRGPGLALAAAIIVALASPLLGMVGDFQKNALGLVWLSMLTMALHGWIEQPNGRRGATCLACIALLGLTHIGVLGSALLFIAATGGFALLLNAGRAWRAQLPWVLGAAVVLALASSLVLWKFDPARIHRLFGALTHPALFVRDDLLPTPPGGAGLPGAILFRWVPSGLFAMAAVPALLLVWRRRSLVHADAVVVAGCALTTLALTGPWFGFDKASRFQLIALIPATLTGAFLLILVPLPWLRRGLALGAVGLLIGPSTIKLANGGRPFLSDAAMLELASLRRLVTDPSRTLISAQHGAEWWTAWFLHTRIAQGSALEVEDWNKFERVLFLQVKSGMQMPDFGLMGLAGGPQHFGNGMAPAMESARKFAHLPPTGGLLIPRADGKLPPLMAAPIPADAEVLHDGAHLKLARVLEPPPALRPRPTAP